MKKVCCIALVLGVLFALLAGASAESSDVAIEDNGLVIALIANDAFASADVSLKSDIEALILIAEQSGKSVKVFGPSTNYNANVLYTTESIRTPEISLAEYSDDRPAGYLLKYSLQQICSETSRTMIITGSIPIDAGKNPNEQQLYESRNFQWQNRQTDIVPVTETGASVIQDILHVYAPTLDLSGWNFTEYLEDNKGPYLVTFLKDLLGEDDIRVQYGETDEAEDTATISIPYTQIKNAFLFIEGTSLGNSLQITSPDGCVYTVLFNHPSDDFEEQSVETVPQTKVLYAKKCTDKYNHEFTAVKLPETDTAQCETNWSVRTVDSPDGEGLETQTVHNISISLYYTPDTHISTESLLDFSVSGSFFDDGDELTFNENIVFVENTQTQRWQSVDQVSFAKNEEIRIFLSDSPELKHYLTLYPNLVPVCSLCGTETNVQLKDNRYFSFVPSKSGKYILEICLPGEIASENIVTCRFELDVQNHAPEVVCAEEQPMISLWEQYPEHIQDIDIKGCFYDADPKDELTLTIALSGEEPTSNEISLVGNAGTATYDPENDRIRVKITNTPQESVSLVVRATDTEGQAVDTPVTLQYPSLEDELDKNLSVTATNILENDILRSSELTIDVICNYGGEYGDDVKHFVDDYVKCAIGISNPNISAISSPKADCELKNPGNDEIKQYSAVLPLPEQAGEYQLHFYMYTDENEVLGWENSYSLGTVNVINNAPVIGETTDDAREQTLYVTSPQLANFDLSFINGNITDDENERIFCHIKIINEKGGPRIIDSSNIVVKTDDTRTNEYEYKPNYQVPQSITFSEFGDYEIHIQARDNENLYSAELVYRIHIVSLFAVIGICIAALLLLTLLTVSVIWLCKPKFNDKQTVTITVSPEHDDIESHTFSLKGKKRIALGCTAQCFEKVLLTQDEWNTLNNAFVVPGKDKASVVYKKGTKACSSVRIDVK